jgi:hypothetical protein
LDIVNGGLFASLPFYQLRARLHSELLLRRPRRYPLAAGRGKFPGADIALADAEVQNSRDGTLQRAPETWGALKWPPGWR